MTGAWGRHKEIRGSLRRDPLQLKMAVDIEAGLCTVEHACRGFRQEFESSRRATIRFGVASGEQMQIDFGQVLS